MAEPQLNRSREEPPSQAPECSADPNSSTPKRSRSKHAAEEEEPPRQDISTYDFDFAQLAAEEESSVNKFVADAECSSVRIDEDDGMSSVMRHLLEASDDELGIPSKAAEDYSVGFSSSESFPVDFGGELGFWELEDVAANYYILLQLELLP